MQSYQVELLPSFDMQLKMVESKVQDYIISSQKLIEELKNQKEND